MLTLDGPLSFRATLAFEKHTVRCPLLFFFVTLEPRDASSLLLLSLQMSGPKVYEPFEQHTVRCPTRVDPRRTTPVLTLDGTLGFRATLPFQQHNIT